MEYLKELDKILREMIGEGREKQIGNMKRRHFTTIYGNEVTASVEGSEHYTLSIEQAVEKKLFPIWTSPEEITVILRPLKWGYEWNKAVLSQLKKLEKRFPQCGKWIYFGHYSSGRFRLF